MARKGLINFTRYTFPKYRPADHHYQIAEKLEAVARGEIKRLMIFMPPRHGKSELASRRFPAFVLGDNPERNFIAASYNLDLASDFGREVRNLIKSPEYQILFECSVAGDSGAADRWHTQKGGSYVAAGVGTAITGRGAHVFLIDDPIKDRESASSDTIKRKTYEWYTSTAYTRLESDIADAGDDPDAWLWDVGGAVSDGLVEPFEGAVVLIQTRWADDDLAGRLIEDMENGADQWDMLELPAIKDETALWPAKYPLSRLNQIKRAIGARDFNALYQQNPIPEDGEYFKSSWLLPYTARPDLSTLRVYGASDYAVTDDGGDYTVHIVVGVDPRKRLWLLDLWRGQTDSAAWVDEFCRLVKEWKPSMWAEETGQIKSALGPFIKEQMRKRGAHVQRRVFPTRHDKAVRSQSIRGRMSLDGLHVPINEPWYADFKHELIRFPAGKHDDQVDALGLIGQLLDRLHGGESPDPDAHERRDAYREEDERNDDWADEAMVI